MTEFCQNRTLLLKRIRILHTVDWFGYGGMERGVLKLMNGLNRPQFEPHLIALRNVEQSIIPHLQQDVRVTALQKREGRDMHLVSRLADYIRQNQIDIVHSHNWGAWLYSQLAALRARVPVFIHGEHGRDTEQPEDGLLKRIFKSVLAGQCRQFTTVSQDIAALLKKQWLVPERKIRIIENGIDLERFFPVDKRAAKKRIGVDTNVLLIGAVIGSLRPVKDLPTLFQSLALVNTEVDKWQLLIVGGRQDGADDEYSRSLKKLIIHLGLAQKVTFIGPQENVERYMQAFDLYVNSSVYEGMSNTILEGMGCAAAVVATKVGGTPNIVRHDETGLLTSPKSPQDLAAHLLLLLNDEKKRHLLAANGRSYVQSYHSRQRFIDEHAELYLSLMTAPRLDWSASWLQPAKASVGGR